YSPYPNKVTMLLDILDNLPRLRMSSAQFKLILWLLEQCNIPGVPSFDAFRKFQSELRKRCGSEPQPFTSMLGNHFHVNNIRDSVARDFSNPEIAQHLRFYPEDVGQGPLSEVWQAQRWKEFDPSELTPMYSRHGVQFYIGEVALLRSQQPVIPQAWVMRQGQLYADCKTVTVLPEGWRINVDGVESHLADEFSINYPTLSLRYSDKIPWTDILSVPQMPSKLRELAGGDDLYVVMCPLWCDDVSGNQSKQYNKHINIYMVNSNLPGRLLQQEYFVRFVSTSPHASALEQFAAVTEQVKETHQNPVRCFNAVTHRPCRVILRIPSLPADNPQQSEECSHMGGNANLKCRKCKNGGPLEETGTDSGYHALHFAGEPRTAEYTRSILLRQIHLAMYGVEKPIKDLQTATGVKDKIAQHWIDTLLEKSRHLSSTTNLTHEQIYEQISAWFYEQPGQWMNPLLSVPGLDPCRDTPVEILHTILLGVAKYVWWFLHNGWKENEQNIFALRLQSTDIDGLNVPPIRAAYMMQYRNNLIGKHFKTLMQTMVFHVHGLVNHAQFNLIKSLGSLGALLWIPEINNLDTYFIDLRVAIANVLDSMDDLEPSKIIQKMKLQVLIHLEEDIRRFGPAVRYSTEIFECFNAVFRLCSILSNHLAPSRDIATKFASMDRIKHILSGGYWYEDGSWVCASKNVLQLLHEEPVLQNHLGWAPACERSAGICGIHSSNHLLMIVVWETTRASKSVWATPEDLLSTSPESKWRFGVSVTSNVGDLCKVGSWVLVSASGVQQVVAGRICEIVVQTSSIRVQDRGLVTVEQFYMSSEPHPEFDMPSLRRADQHSQYLTVGSKDILCLCSVQHNCRAGGCMAQASHNERQERQETTRVVHAIQHSDDDQFILNLHALHNAGHIRKLLPRNLVAVKPLYADRKLHHCMAASKLRTDNAQKREKAQAKR
ncbi:hypothetical protein CONPUDRAFT_25752, partial [Coniophora puteana RWD-64-598 SS2]